MTAGIVPAIPPLVNADQVKSGRAVRGTATHYALGQTMNWNLGRGAQLIAANSPGESLAIGATHVYHYRVWPRQAAFRRRWAVQLAGGSSSTNQVEIIINGGTKTVTATLGSATLSARPIFITEELASVSTSEAEATISIENKSGIEAIRVLSIACWELPRPELTLGSGSSEYGSQLSALRSNAPIFDGNGYSIVGLADAVKTAETGSYVHRPGMFAFAVDPNNAPFSGTSGNIFELDPIVLGRLTHRNNTTTDVYCRSYGRTTVAGTTGTITFTANSGDSVVLTIPDNQSFNWFVTADHKLTIDAEDLSTSDGRRGGSWETVAITISRTAGTGNIEIASAIMGEVPP